MASRFPRVAEATPVANQREFLGALSGLDPLATTPQNDSLAKVLAWGGTAKPAYQRCLLVVLLRSHVPSLFR